MHQSIGGSRRVRILTPKILKGLSDAPMDPVSVTDAKPERRLQESVGNASFLDTQRKIHVEGTYGDDIRSAWRRREKGLMQPASLGRTIAVT